MTMRKAAFLIPASPNAAFFSQVAAFSLALRRLEWERWSPTLLVCFGEGMDDDGAALYARWRRLFPEATVVFAPENGPNEHYHNQMDGLFRWAPRDADVLVRVDADTLPVASLEPMLDLVLERSAIAGTIAHYRFPPRPGIGNRAAWLLAADGLIEQPLRFDYAYSLTSTDLPVERRSTPYYLNDGCVFFARRYFDQFAPHYLDLRPRLMDRLRDPWFACQVALALSVARIRLPAIALPLRYNFPNADVAALRYPEELENAKVFHYMRTEEIDRQAIFRSAEHYRTFLAKSLTAANAKFRDAVRNMFGEAYPFAIEPQPPAVASAAAKRPELRDPAPCLVDQDALVADLNMSTLAGLMSAKRRLVASLGIMDGYAKYRELASLSKKAGLARKSLMGQADYAARHAAKFVVTHAGGKPFRVPPLRIIGEGQSSDFISVSRPTHVACIEGGAVLRGNSAVIELEHHALLEFYDEELDWFDINVDIDPAVFHGDRHSVWVVSSEKDKHRLDVDEAFTLLGPHFGAFGDFMMTYLPRYVWADMSGALPRVPVLVHRRVPASITQAIRLFVHDDVELVPIAGRQSVKVGRLWCASNLTYAPASEVMDERYSFDHNFPFPDQMRLVVRELNRRAAPHVVRAPAPDRVYLSRRSNRWRRVVNGPDLEAIAEQEGFRIVYPEEHDFIGQINLVANASHVVAPEGSALFLCYFARSGTKVCILQQQSMAEGMNVYDAFFDGCDITMVTGPVSRCDPIYPHRSDYMIDPEMFRGFLGPWSRS